MLIDIDGQNPAWGYGKQEQLGQLAQQDGFAQTPGSTDPHRVEVGTQNSVCEPTAG